MCNLRKFFSRAMAGFVSKEGDTLNYDGVNVMVDNGRFFENNFGKYHKNNKSFL